MKVVDELDFSKERSDFFAVQGALLKKNFERRHIPTHILGGAEMRFILL